MTQATCRKCGGEMSLATLDTLSGDQGDTKLTITEMPALVCPENHRRLVGQAFADHVLEKVEELAEQQAPPAQEKGLIFKHHLCRSCGMELSDDALHRRTLHVDVDVEEAAPFGVDLETPLYTCPKCGAEQVPSKKSLENTVPLALVHAFQSGEITPR